MWRLLITPAVAFLFVAGALLYYYEGRYQPDIQIPRMEDLSVPPSAIGEFFETPTPRPGVLLVDQAHSNNFDLSELHVLLARVAARGYKVESLDRNGFGDKGSEKGARLESKLRSAEALVVALPIEPFSKEEAEVVKAFVAKGGRLLLIGDATRPSRLNSLASAFGITFEEDYLYNVVEHEANFQNIFLTDFRGDKLTRNLKKVVFYSGSSITAPGGGFIFADDNTYSSLIERRGRFAAAVLAGNSRVIALSDLTFMGEPFNTAWDNDQLIANIADFLAESPRLYTLGDFPHFFREPVNIVISRGSLLESGTQTKQLLSSLNKKAQLKESEDFLQDTVFLTLFGDAASVSHYLAAAQIRVGSDLQTPFAPPVSSQGSALLYLQRHQDRYVLVILADAPETMEKTLGLLKSGTFREGLVSDMVGLYPPALTK